MKQFTHTAETTNQPADARRGLMSEVVPTLGDWQYTIVSDSEDAIAMQREYRSWVVIVLAIFFFPIGLLFLLIKSTALLTFTFAPTDTGTRIQIAGRAPRPVAKALQTADF